MSAAESLERGTDRQSLVSRLRRIGPAIIVAAVVLGPGSIVGASKVGCEYGLDLLWVVPLAGLLMIAMTTASMIIGATSEKTLCQSVADARKPFSPPRRKNLP